jgi:hypothetical protein
VRFEVLMVVSMKYVFWDMAPCILEALADEWGEIATSSYRAGLLFYPKG